MDDLLDEIINSLDEDPSSSTPSTTSTTTTSSSLLRREDLDRGRRHQVGGVGSGDSRVVAAPLDDSGQPRPWAPSVSLAEGGLYVWASAARWLGAFERHGWMFTPLHPAVVSEDGLRSLLGGGSGSGSPPSSLSSSSSSSWLSSSFSTLTAATSPASIRQAVFDLNINTALAYGTRPHACALTHAHA
jgi:hypothetical protein